MVRWDLDYLQTLIDRHTLTVPEHPERILGWIMLFGTLSADVISRGGDRRKGKGKWFKGMPSSGGY
jgi:hypothetical protein